MIIERNGATLEHGLHTHSDYELLFVSGAEGALHITGDSVHEVSDYELIMIAPGLEHGWKQHNCHNENTRAVIIRFSSDFLVDSYLRQNGAAHVIEMLGLSSQGLSFGFSTIMDEYALINRITSAQEPFEAMLRLHMLLFHLGRSRNYNTLSTLPSDHKTPTARIVAIRHHIEENYAAPLAFSDIAGTLGMSASALSRLFKQSTGFTISEYLMNTRLAAATRRLCGTDATVGQICFACGFNNLSHFSRCFRAKYGCTPTEFRSRFASYRR